MELLEGTKNLIFDFGGVIINIDFEKTFRAFSELGIKNVYDVWKTAWNQGLLTRFEKGLIDPEEFRLQMAEISGVEINRNQFDEAWNQMILDIPEERICLLEKLKKTHKVFLLSNTNIIHYNYYATMVNPMGYQKLDDVFDKAYFSFRMGMAKPDSEIFLKVLENEKLVASETLFIDDMSENVLGAKKVGMKSLCIEPGKLLHYFNEF